MSPLRGIWKCWNVENTRIDFSTPIGLVRKDTEKLSYLTSVGLLKYTIRRAIGTTIMRGGGVFVQQGNKRCVGCTQVLSETHPCHSGSTVVVTSIVIVRPSTTIGLPTEDIYLKV